MNVLLLGFHWDEGRISAAEGTVLPVRTPVDVCAYADELIVKAWRTGAMHAGAAGSLRAEQAAQAGTGYDRHCRDLGEAERRGRSVRVKPVIRLKVPLDG